MKIGNETLNDPFVIPPAHLNYFDHRNLRLFLSHCGFTVRRVQFITRIPPRALNRRFRRFGTPTVAAAGGLANLTARAMDLARLGMMVNVYASKNGRTSHHAA